MKVIPFLPADARERRVLKEKKILAEPSLPAHQHKEMQISLILSGDGMLTIGNYSQPFRPGNIFIIGANQSHHFACNPLDSNINADTIHLHFDVKRIPETFFLLPELAPVRKFIASCATGLQLPTEYETQAAALIQKISLMSNLERLLGLLEIIHLFTKIDSGWKTLSTGIYNYGAYKSEGKRMKDIFKYTLDNYAENITLNKIASIAHITPHAFCKYFKQHTRKTYNNFLNEVRVNEACKKIISGSYDGLSAIAYKTGFKGASNFNRVFKKTTGMSPSDYKKEFRNKTA